jgi:hypothetical protein
MGVANLNPPADYQALIRNVGGCVCEEGRVSIREFAEDVFFGDAIGEPIRFESFDE